jgi:membrane-associated phospholipid phosphatase
VFDRPRPGFTDPLVRLCSYSFPGGHTAATTLFYGLLMVVALRHVRSWRGRLVIVAASVVIVGLVGGTASTSGPII